MTRITSASNLLNLDHLNPLNEIIESLKYVYDVNSNRISMDRFSSFSGLTGESIVKLPEPMAATYNEANRMMTYNEENLVYDENGNLIQKGDAVYEWDVRGSLISITSPSLKASFKYDALGRRVEKTINGKTTQYLYDGLDIIQEIEDGMVSANYIRTLNIDEPLVRIKSDGTIRYYQQDALGSVIALTDETGIVKTQYVYDPFGNTEVMGEPSDNPFQYTGRENDNTGLYYYRARYYSPELQRFISEDPIGLVGGINLYSYVGNSPMNYKDPEGKGPIAVGVCIGLIIYDTASTIHTLEKLNKEIEIINKKIKELEKSCDGEGIDEQKLDEIGKLLKQKTALLKKKTRKLAIGTAVGIPIAYFCYASPALPF